MKELMQTWGQDGGEIRASKPLFRQYAWQRSKWLHTQALAHRRAKRVEAATLSGFVKLLDNTSVLDWEWLIQYTDRSQQLMEYHHSSLSVRTCHRVT